MPNVTFNETLPKLISSLPTTDPVSVGALWNSSGVVKVSVVPVAYIAAGTLVDHGASTSTTLNVPYPAGIQNNDVAFIMCHSESALGTDHTISTPSGWTLVSEQAYTLSWIRQGIFYKRLTGSETGTVAVSTTIGGAAQDGHSAVMVIFRNCITTGTPYEGMAVNTGNSTSMTGSAVTTIGSNRLLVDFGTHFNTTTITPATGYTENLDVATAAGSDNGHTIQSKLIANAAQVNGAAAHTISASSRWSVVSLALIPASGGNDAPTVAPTVAGNGNYEAAPQTIPVRANFTAFNLGASVTSDTSKGIYIKAQNNDQLRGWVTTPPGATYDIFLRADMLWLSASLTSNLNFSSGVILRNSANGRLIYSSYYAHRPSSIVYHKHETAVWDGVDATTAVIGARATVAGNQPIKWHKVSVTATQATFHTSTDGITWTDPIWTETWATYVGTPNQVGFVSYANGAASIYSTVFGQFGFVQPV